MRILCLEPYYGGSHRDFIDGWTSRSSHSWTLLTLPANKWKWRMRHGAITLSRQVAIRSGQGETWDLVFCSDMLNLAEFMGLVPAPVRQLPSIVYFHENQLTYPVQHESEFDYHFAFTNMTTALAARCVWFNSEFHLLSFLSGLRDFLRRMPDCRPMDELALIETKSLVRPPGIESFPARGPRRAGPIRILWNARWEYDKAPHIFFEALSILKEGEYGFELSVVGGGDARNVPPVFSAAREHYAGHILHWGYQEDRSAYRSILAEADVVVSTADHEFFGIGVVEAAAAGAYPIVPDRLAYPEVLGAGDCAGQGSFFYDGTAQGLADRLRELADLLVRGSLWQGDSTRGIRAVARFAWDALVPAWDKELGVRPG